MKTRINLYTQEFVPQRVWLSLPQMVSVWALILLLILLSSTWLNYRQQEMQALARQSTADLTLQQTQLSALQAKLAQHKSSPRLQKLLQQQQAELSVKQKLLAAVGRNETFKNAGFAGVLTDLARVNDPDIRVTEIKVADGQISLGGISYSNSAVPRWIGRFKGTQTLAGQEFAELKVVRNEQQEMVFELVAAAKKSEVSP
ncbi:PilN domain-containing protein [Motilimonas cestriensis]|uniref:PilN domain-containing protein n=1 Tax=Motilimonas cestriensis TaxID=2742685 RepID=UPI003DA2C1C2